MSSFFQECIVCGEERGKTALQRCKSSSCSKKCCRTRNVTCNIHKQVQSHASGTSGEAVPSAVGPSKATHYATGPSEAGPSTVGPSAAGPSAAGPSAAGPSAAGHSAAGPSTTTRPPPLPQCPRRPGPIPNPEVPKIAEIEALLSGDCVTCKRNLQETEADEDTVMDDATTNDGEILVVTLGKM